MRRACAASLLDHEALPPAPGVGHVGRGPRVVLVNLKRGTSAVDVATSSAVMFGRLTSITRSRRMRMNVIHVLSGDSSATAAACTWRPPRGTSAPATPAHTQTACPPSRPARAGAGAARLVGGAGWRARGRWGPGGREREGARGRAKAQAAAGRTAPPPPPLLPQHQLSPAQATVTLLAPQHPPSRPCTGPSRAGSPPSTRSGRR